MILLLPHVEINEQVYFEILKESQWLCGYCGNPIDDKSAAISFKTPPSLGGEATFENLLAACKLCEKLKGRQTLEEFRASVFEDIAQAIDKAWDVYEKTGFLMDDFTAADVRRVLVDAKTLLKNKILTREARFFFETQDQNINVMSFCDLKQEKEVMPTE